MWATFPKKEKKGARYERNHTEIPHYQADPDTNNSLRIRGAQNAVCTRLCTRIHNGIAQLEHIHRASFNISCDDKRWSLDTPGARLIFVQITQEYFFEQWINSLQMNKSCQVEKWKYIFFYTRILDICVIQMLFFNFSTPQMRGKVENHRDFVGVLHFFH